MHACHSCKKELTLPLVIGRRDLCPHCRADLHCCLNCRFYDRSASKQCKEPVAEMVKEKTKANYCDFFVFAAARAAGAVEADPGARRALDDLFKK